jgi:hypothetical protein
VDYFSLLFNCYNAFYFASFNKSINLTASPFLVENFFPFYPVTTPKPICSTLCVVNQPAFLAAKNIN